MDTTNNCFNKQFEDNLKLISAMTSTSTNVWSISYKLKHLKRKLYAKDVNAKQKSVTS